MLCTYLGGLACKLHMQRAAFALPLVLSPPLSLVVVYLQCRYEFLSESWHTGTWYCPNLAWESLREPLAVGAGLWLSYCVIVSQIWFPKVERMAKTERLFLTPHFHSIFPDFNLTLRRRQDKGNKKSKRSVLHQKQDQDCETGQTGREDKWEAAVADDTGVPTIYVCATMWHETLQEMTQLLKSLFRLDYNHYASKFAQAKYNIRDPDFFNMEIQIMFDDAFELDKKSKKHVHNKWVRQFISCMEDAARSVIKGHIFTPAPIEVATPYGGRLVWTMPGQNQLVVHLKDKRKIRHRKRWSQVMYMYYLLGFKTLGHGDGSHLRAEELTKHHHHHSPSVRHRKGKGARKTERERKTLPLREMLMRMSRQEYDELVHKCENTFILALDGDIDFKPESVKVLMDSMKKDKKVAAVCGRIHPIGSGPLVWYQQFEYAVSHWLQKAAEHVFGCVLCCPGCFSLFRASALMDDNVMKTYTTAPTEARHYIQFEQGEDRWLCTLLLQQGYRIVYNACADALTYAPETFSELFNQRRRWSPSTMANIIDLLGSWRTTIRVNDNISRLFMLYQIIVMVSTIISPSFLILLMTYAFQTVLELNTWWSYVLAMAPVAFYIFICFTKENETQIKVGAMLSALYAVVMMIITVSTIISIVQDDFGSPNVIFIALLAFIFITASLLHPKEFFCLLPGVIYFLTIPANFLLLTVFYLCNLNNVSWGTREVANKIEARKAPKGEKSWNIFSAKGLKNVVDEIRELVKSVWGLERGFAHQQQGQLQSQTREEAATLDCAEGKDPSKQLDQEAEPRDSNWLGLSSTGDGPVETLGEAEIGFWNSMIQKYLYPLDLNEEGKKKLSDDLRELRNNIVFICIMVNLLWTVIALQLQAAEDRLKNIYVAGRYEPIAVVFLAVFAIILVFQFVGMVVHSWGTFLRFMSTTHIDWFSGEHSDEEFARYVVNEVAKNQSLEPPEDYSDDDSSEGSLGETLPLDFEGDTENSSRVRIQTQALRRTDNQDLFPDDVMSQPSVPGHFPQLKQILDHRWRQNRKSDLRREVRRRQSWESGNSEASERDAGLWKRHWPAWGADGHRRHGNQGHFWNAKNATMKHRFLKLQEMRDIRGDIIKE